MSRPWAVHLLPPELRMGTAEQWGLKRDDGTWLTWPPDNEVAYFMSAAGAQAYADRRNAPGRHRATR